MSNEEYSTLAEGFADKASWKINSAGADDVANAYRLILGREAESPQVVDEKIGLTHDRLFSAFLSSREFRDKLSTHNGQIVIDPVLLSPLPPYLLDWFFATLQFSDGIGTDFAPGAGRLAAISILLSTPQICAAVEEESQGIFDVKATLEAIDQTFATASTIRESPLFDEQYYRAQMDGMQVVDAALHYLLLGERANMRPSTVFDPLSYHANNSDLNTYWGNLLYHFERYGRVEGRAIDSAQDQIVLQSHAAALRASPLFDEDFYRAQLGFESRSVRDAALHYLVEGEAAGLIASANFDAATYAELHPDIGASNINRLLHYVMHGREEGRSFAWAIDALQLRTDRLDPAKRTVILLMHQASHTGAPILGWNIGKALMDCYNIVVLMMTGGTLAEAVESDFSAAIGPLPVEFVGLHEHHARLARRIVLAYDPIYVIANSAETRLPAVALRDRGIPVVGLIHEFTGTLPDGINEMFFLKTAALVFPAEIVREDEWRAYKAIGMQSVYIIPQGASVVPPFPASVFRRTPILPRIGDELMEAQDIDVLFSGKRGDGPFIVVGMGTVEIRKGIDLFIAAATSLSMRQPDLDFRFVWIGSWDHAVGQPYGKLLAEQILRAGLQNKLCFMPAVDNLGPIYARADALFLSSRLDPLPNVSIDAALHDVPIVCFASASGMAELISTEPEIARLVVPHLDLVSAVDRLEMLAQEPAARRMAGEAIGRMARQIFDMESYVERIDQLGLIADKRRQRADHECQVIVDSGLFEPAVFFPLGHSLENDSSKIGVAQYLDDSRQVNYASTNVYPGYKRRPMLGFHPFIYGTMAPGFPTDNSRDALAHFIEAGCPDGPWRHQVIKLADVPAQPAAVTASPNWKRFLGQVFRKSNPAVRQSSIAQAALHGHFHYTDNIDDFIEALAANRTEIDLFLTTNSDSAASIVRKAVRSYKRGRVTIEVLQNFGRDVAPFLSVLRRHVQHRYPIVGHIHGKRSLDPKRRPGDFDMGNRWRTFLWQNLIGPGFPSADIIIEQMRQDDTLGLVFPENDLMVGWEKNRGSAMALLPRLGLKGPLPLHLEFPLGTMFWARTAALQALIDADFQEHDYPSEPIALDGTVLHALERLISLINEGAGYRYATTFSRQFKR